MFNQSGFNRLPFNRSEGERIIYMSAHLSGVGSGSANAEAEITASVHLSGVGGGSAVYTREIPNSAHLSGAGSGEATMLAEFAFSAHLSGEGSMSANADKYTTSQITIPGNFTSGQKITLDSDKLSVRKNGVDITHETEGLPFDLQIGTNKITYTDNASSRNIRAVITRRDQFI